MDTYRIVATLKTRLQSLKTMYDNHKDVRIEIQELQEFIDDYEEQLRELQNRYIMTKTSDMCIVALNHLNIDILNATSTLDGWLVNGSFFELFNSVDRLQKIQDLHGTVMTSMQNKIEIVGLFLILDVPATKINFEDDLQIQLKSILSMCMTNMSQKMAQNVKFAISMASRSKFADMIFWEDILANVDNADKSKLQDLSMFVDPISKQFVIDPVVCSNGITYCRWTLIDKKVLMDPCNPSAKLEILADNVTLKEELFKKFPLRNKEFEKRRKNYRQKAFSLAKEGHFSDAIFALQHVLLYDKVDNTCAALLIQMERALKDEPIHLQHENVHLKAQVDELKTQICQFKCDIESRQQLLDKKEIQLNAKDEEVKVLKKKMMDCEKSMEKKLASESQKYEELQKHVGGLRNQIQKLEGWNSVKDWQDESLSLSKEVKQAMDEFAAVQKKFQKTNIRFQAINDRNAKVKVLQNQLKDLQKTTCSKFFKANGSKFGENYDFHNHSCESPTYYPSHQYSKCDFDVNSFEDINDVIGGDSDGSPLAKLPHTQIVEVERMVENISSQLKEVENIPSQIVEVEEVVENIPSELNTTKCSSQLNFSTNKLVVTHTGFRGFNNVSSIQTNHPVPYHGSIYYFEMTIKKCGAKESCSIGFTGENFKRKLRPGWDVNGYGYHGDDGKLYTGNRTKGVPYASVYTTNDTVGAGINHVSKEIFFTKNGFALPSIKANFVNPLYPTISLTNLEQNVEVNFGQSNFVFDIKTMNRKEVGA